MPFINADLAVRGGCLVDNDALAIVRAYHDAWTTRDFDHAGRRLSDALLVEVPINAYPTKADFLRAVAYTRDMVSRVHLLAEFGDTSEAMLLYDMQLPMCDLRVAEHFTVSEGQITRIRQIHDTAAIRAAGIGQSPHA